LIALLAPGRKALHPPELVLNWLIDLPIDAIYLQPLNLHPVRDSFEKLAAYVAFAESFALSTQTRKPIPAKNGKGGRPRSTYLLRAGQDHPAEQARTPAAG
jgi:hypothetical protein